MRLLLTLTLLALSLPHLSHAADHPVAKVVLNPGGPYDDNVRLWQGIPGIERAPKGRLWVTWYTGDTGEGDMGNYAMAATSANDGKSWSRPAIAIQGPPGTRIGDPIPWLDPKGRLWIFWAQLTAAVKDPDPAKARPLLRGTFAIRCDDPDSAAPKWTAPRLVFEGGILFGKPLVRAGDSAWVAPFFMMAPPTPDFKETGTILTTDAGETWQWLGGASIPKDLRNFSEATIAQRRDGSLWMVIRTLKGLHESSSKDGGKTWTEPSAMPKFGSGPATRACMRRLASGNHLMIYHDAPKSADGGYPRANLVAWLSEDEGRTWPHQIAVDERNRVSYPDATQGPDGRIYIAYDHGRYEPGDKQILAGVIREEDIRAGKIVSKDSHLKLQVNKAFGYGNHSDLRQETETAANLPPKDKLHIYLLIGQSNMAGRGLLDTENRISRTRLLKFSPNNKWTTCLEPLHHDKPYAVGAGIGMSFARAMADSAPKDITVGVVPCAVGGTPLERWVKGGDLYAQALERARAALQNGTLKGILWHQGEGDSADEAKSLSYAQRLSTMITDLRADLGAGDVPFVAGKLGIFLSPLGKDGKPSHWQIVNEQIASIPGKVPHTAVAESTDLKHKGDGVHFDTPSLRTFGERYAEAMKKLQK